MGTVHITYNNSMFGTCSAISVLPNCRCIRRPPLGKETGSIRGRNCRRRNWEAATVVEASEIRCRTALAPSGSFTNCWGSVFVEKNQGRMREKGGARRDEVC